MDSVKEKITEICEKARLDPRFCIAVAMLESNLEPYLPDVKFPTLKFYKYTFISYFQKPEIPKLIKATRIEGEDYEAYKQASRISPKKAMLSTSFGLYQIMGYNYDDIGYNSVENMVKDFTDSVEAQIKAFIEYVRFINLDFAINKKDFNEFARVYNGVMYYKTEYISKLERAYEDAR